MNKALVYRFIGFSYSALGKVHKKKLKMRWSNQPENFSVRDVFKYRVGNLYKLPWPMDKLESALWVKENFEDIKDAIITRNPEGEADIEAAVISAVERVIEYNTVGDMVYFFPDMKERVAAALKEVEAERKLGMAMAVKKKRGRKPKPKPKELEYDKKASAGNADNVLKREDLPKDNLPTSL